MWSPLAPWLAKVAEFRKYIKTPLIHACRVADVATARHAITEDILDLIGMTRAHIADPHIVRKIQEKKEHEICPASVRVIVLTVCRRGWMPCVCTTWLQDVRRRCRT